MKPVSSDDVAGLHEVREALPLDVAAGEYGYDLFSFERMCAAGAVDVLQAEPFLVGRTGREFEAARR